MKLFFLLVALPLAAITDSAAATSVCGDAAACCAPTFSTYRQSNARCTAREWNFAVSLDGRAIGYHRFALDAPDEHNAARHVVSEARFAVKILFINAYRYVHSAEEVWQGDCLQRLQARTDDNGRYSVVLGSSDSSRFHVELGRKTNEVTDRYELDRCVQTFAYWNPNILSATHLLNPQTGEYVAVTVTDLGAETLATRADPIVAHRYRLSGRQQDGTPLRIDLWYSPAREWLALESLTDGHLLRYERR